MCILARLAGKRVVLSLRSEVRADAHDRWIGWFKRLSFKSCSTIICQSDIAARSLVKLFGHDSSKIVVIPNWIDSSEYRCPDHAQESRQLDARNSTTRFLFVGWLEASKGVYELLAAARILMDRAVDFHLVFCGKGSEWESLNQKNKELGTERHVAFRGWVTGQALIDELWKADVFVLPSYTEGLPNSLLQAMACGLAVIVTPVGGIPSLVEPERNGLIVQVKENAQLAEAMATLAADPGRVREMGERNAQLMIQKHDITHIWPSIAELL
jgi:glycosyltransferase involved in cell wall biosynthesis